MTKIPITVRRVRTGRMVFDSLHHMELYVPDDPRGRARLVVNPARAFDHRSFRSRKMNRATLILACPAGLWKPTTRRCVTSQVVQSVYYRAGERDRVVREFCSGALQQRHTREQEQLKIAQMRRRRA